MKLTRLEDSIGWYFLDEEGRNHREDGPSAFWFLSPTNLWYEWHLCDKSYTQKEWLEKLLAEGLASEKS